ncbi:NAD(P)-binding protein [Piedraia hortae CBS 480.64]|uniref:NAD(P)-binding protein n=1 Tax=Piedraia hortae CBS 480.64 TaxID=1314780 RepID=A0A6A7BNW2_9PEZI|nr:NAD(P)-binding protein [Piedraia hortae CBS 480.64]
MRPHSLLLRSLSHKRTPPTQGFNPRPLYQAKAPTHPVQSGINDPHRDAHRSNSSILRALPPILSKFTLVGKHAVVTGGARGLGYSISQAFCEAGCERITLFDVQASLGREAARRLGDDTGVKAEFFAVDVRDEEAVCEVVGALERVDVLVNCAGVADSNIKAESYPIPTFRNLIDINLTGTFIVSQAVGRRMIASSTKNSPTAVSPARSSIINLSSIAGSIVCHPQEQSAYNASKAGVRHLSKSLATEWAKYGIRVNCIAPGYMDTALNRVPELDALKDSWREGIPMRRLGQVDEIDGVAVFLASEASNYVTGECVTVDGGFTLW